MLKRTVALLLLFCLVTVSLSQLLVLAGFGMNESYIVKELCINRNQPQLHCNGKCYLTRKLKQAQEKEQKQENQNQKLQLQEAIVTVPLSFKQFEADAVYLRIPLTTGIPVAQMNAVFHPPQISC
jgi:hypothetical protein